MNIFVTTGSAFPFDSLIQFLDELNLNNGFNFVFQIGDGSYIPTNHKYYRYVSNISEWFDWADLVICHGGAGSIYHLLEEEIPFIAVANFDRDNGHQTDICSFLLRENLAYAAINMIELKEILSSDLNKQFNPYSNDNESILKFINKELDNLGI